MEEIAMNAPASSAAASPLVLREDHGGVATLTLNRPQQFNALSLDALLALQEALAAIATDRSVRVVVIAGAGKAYCPGHDLKEMLADRSREAIGGLFERCCEAMMAITRLPQPVIARVHGIATAAGCQLAATCDFAVASTQARFATSGINLGLFCFTPGVPVARTISRKRALEMLMTGDFIDAQTALDWGLVNRVVAPEALDTAVAELAAKLIAKPAAVLAHGKKFFYEQAEMGMADAYRLAARMITDNMLGPEAHEGVSAFVEKRKPNWPV